MAHTYNRDDGTFNPIHPDDLHTGGANYILVDAGVGGQTIPGSEFTKIAFDHVQQDDDGVFDTVNYRYQPKVGGIYLVSCQVAFSGVSPSSIPVGVAIYKNGSKILQGGTMSGPGSGVFAACTAPISMNGTTDYIEFYAYQGLAQGQDLHDSPDNTWAAATRIWP